MCGGLQRLRGSARGGARRHRALPGDATREVERPPHDHVLGDRRTRAAPAGGSGRARGALYAHRPRVLLRRGPQRPRPDRASSFPPTSTRSRRRASSGSRSATADSRRSATAPRTATRSASRRGSRPTSRARSRRRSSVRTTIRMRISTGSRSTAPRASARSRALRRISRSPRSRSPKRTRRSSSSAIRTSRPARVSW